MELVHGDLIVRNPKAEDAEAVCASVQASLPELEPWMPWAGPGYDVAAASAWIDGKFGDEHRFIMTVGGVLVGSCGLNQFDAFNRGANLGYWLRSDATGHGFASRAAYLVARYGIEQLGFRRVEIMMSVHNDPSRRVAQRIGAVHEGIARDRLLLRGVHHDAHVFSLITRDFETHPDAYL